MEKIKYKLIPTEEAINYRGHSIFEHGIFKYILISSMFLIFTCYYFIAAIQNEEQIIALNLENIEVSSAKYTIHQNTTIRKITDIEDPMTKSTKATSTVSEFEELTTELINITTTSAISLLSNKTTIRPTSTISEKTAYFVDSPECTIPALNPFAADVLKILKKKSYTKCDKSDDSISVIYDKINRTYQLHKNDANSTCCYKQIVRSGERTQADNQYKLKPCTQFEQDFMVPQNVEEIITECQRKNQTKIWQKDAFSFVHPKVKHISMEGRPSVLLWGIDSLSRMNFQRTMPKMFEYLKSQHWFELQGYNKMADNTFPNLMAILTGMNYTRSENVCRPQAVGGLDACPMLWKNFKSKGYATAYAEDWKQYSTFDYNKKGFRKVPTDVYLRPLILALEKELKTVYVSGIPYCLGRRHSAEYIYDAAIQFSQVYKDQPNFGMFWTNSFSHNDFSMPLAMDTKIVEYMRKLDRNGIMENTIILFFSDHGMRFGPLRKLKSGFLEERLPIMYLRLPKWFREKYNKYMINLKQNRNRLTSPYDIHATLKHILELDTPSELLPRPEGCPTCHSVFEEVSSSRSCEQAGLSDKWCACQRMSEIPTNDTTTIKIAEQFVDKLNQFLMSKKLHNLCQHLKLDKIQSALKSSDMVSYRVQFTVKPHNALLEASGIWDSSAQTISTEVNEISRLNTYKDDSKCIKDDEAKKYCICVK